MTNQPRIQQENSASNDTRQKILSLIAATPGITTSELASTLDLHPNTVFYHLGNLEKNRLIKRDLSRKPSPCWSNETGRIGPVQLLEVMMRSTPKRKLITLIAENPGIYVDEAAKKLRRHASTIYRQVNALVELGILVKGNDSDTGKLQIHPTLIIPTQNIVNLDTSDSSDP